MGRPPFLEDSKLICLHIPGHMDRQLRSYAKHNDLTVSEVVRRAILHYFYSPSTMNHWQGTINKSA